MMDNCGISVRLLCPKEVGVDLAATVEKTIGLEIAVQPSTSAVRDRLSE